MPKGKLAALTHAPTTTNSTSATFPPGFDRRKRGAAQGSGPVAVEALVRGLDRPERVEQVKVASQKGIDGIRRHGQAALARPKRDAPGTSSTQRSRGLVQAVDVVEDGLGLRSDLRFNATGNEDKDFFAAAHRGGARIIVSSHPIVYDSIGTRDARVMDLRNKAQVSSVMYRNEIVRLRKEQSSPAATPAPDPRPRKVK
jgi:hypothetical protein